MNSARDEHAVFDVIFAGGGLAAGVTATRLLQCRPELRLLIIEQDATLGGDKTWSFHDTDITPAQRAWLQPLVTFHWVKQQVIFPGYKRELDIAYNTITSEHLHTQLSLRLGEAIKLNTTVTELSANHVTSARGETYYADCVIDARGTGNTRYLQCGYQVFAGAEVELERPHQLQYPVIMDASVEQHGAYRFVYLLPYSATRVLVEDTYYSNSPELDCELVQRRIDDYITARGWRVKARLRTEQGVLPVVMNGDLQRYLGAQKRDYAILGTAAGLFHPTTGYSLPFAVYMADRLSTLQPLTSEMAKREIDRYAIKRWQRGAFYRRLNRMMFTAAEPQQRRVIFERFYRLPRSLVSRFYAGDLVLKDKIRLLAGKPPVKVHKALSCLPEPEFEDPLVAYCRRSIEQGSRSFASASRLFSPGTRGSAWLLYAWCRHCDDEIDDQVMGFRSGTHSEQDIQQRFANVEKLSRAALAGDAQSPEYQALARVVDTCQLPHRYPLDLLEGFAMDARASEYFSIEDTLLYCYHVAGVVGVMMAIVMGVNPDDEDTLDRACDLGLAFQLTNICRDIWEDAQGGRCYLPADWLGQAGVAVDDPCADREALFSVVSNTLALADRFYASARSGIVALPFRSAWAVATARRVYRRIGTELLGNGPLGIDTRTIVSKSSKLAAFTFGLFDTLWLKSFGRLRRPADRGNLWSRRQLSSVGIKP
jgi:lycopene beta-cyclase